MGKMHELLAVEPSVIQAFNAAVAEIGARFGKPDLFTKTVTSRSYFDAASSHLDTVETKEAFTTVRHELDSVRGAIQGAIDVVFQKDSTNRRAASWIEVDGVTIVGDVPATTLLMLESRLQVVRGLIEGIPTLPPGLSWVWNANEGMWQTSEPKTSFVTKKTLKPVVLYEATANHPAQVKELSEDVPVARVTQNAFAGMLAQSDKQAMLARVDRLLIEVKRARQRANDVAAEERRIGDAIVKFLFDGKTEAVSADVLY